MAKIELEKDDLFELYRICLDEIAKLNATYNNRVDRITSIIALVFGGLAAGFFQVSDSYQYWVLLIGPAMIFGLAEIGLYLCFHTRRFIIEQITVRAKIEQLLGLCRKDAFDLPPGSYWSDEAIVPSRYIDDRNRFDSSSDWVAVRTGQRFAWGMYRLFRSFQLAALIVAAGLIFLAY